MKFNKFLSVLLSASLLIPFSTSCYAAELAPQENLPPFFMAESPNNSSLPENPITIESEIEGNRYVKCREMMTTHYVTQLEESRGIIVDGGMAAVGGVVGKVWGAISVFLLEQGIKSGLDSPQANDYLIEKLFITYDRQKNVFIVDKTSIAYRNGALVCNSTTSTEVGPYGRISQAYDHMMSEFSYKIH